MSALAQLPDTLPPGHSSALLNAVCRTFKVSPQDLTGRSRFDRVVKARQAACWLLLRRWPVGLDRKRSLAEIAALVGVKDHSTVLYSVRQAQLHAATIPEYGAVLARLAVIEAAPLDAPAWIVPFTRPLRACERRASHQSRLDQAVAASGGRHGPVIEDDSDAVNRARGSLALLDAINAARRADGATGPGVAA